MQNIEISNSLMSLLPKKISKVKAPPIKCQGIKTKLTQFISESISWDGKGRWIEPFVGSGVILFNIQPKKALISDTNKHIIHFYQSIQKGIITPQKTKTYLEIMDKKLQRDGQVFYNKIREEFNNDSDPLKFLFLNRSCFNGIMRFNSKGKFNVPFGHKPNRFRQSYITKIVNQISWVQEIMRDKDWKFVVSDWRKTLNKVSENDFVYLDPPYVGRHTDYFNTWSEIDAIELSETAKNLSCKFALSMWVENRYRKNTHIEENWNNLHIATFAHFYHVGAKEALRNEMTEGLICNFKLEKYTKQTIQVKEKIPALL